ncbi:hypothetical protein CJF32_00002381 [Rutstroemia sp. NJR-2017a WRK4]|nr:hypothetical protein CJF32_00002178 [Rutstroemia sp. NJR-2017a WRK4]PQE14842.1 hypothetical protein CJF32_00002381 [Rutstroemia sp. NJR-2017a WRK4]
MAAQSEMQDLLRLLTTGRNKLPILTAMQRVKALQSASITPSISSLSTTPLPDLCSALSIDTKAAQALQNACKKAVKTPLKRPAPSSPSLESDSKRAKSAYALPAAPPTEEELERSLQLPEINRDEEMIAQTKIYTNRAPLVLAWVFVLLRYTMPGQGLSGRLSLAQAVVSANSKSKAENLGLRKKGEGEEVVGRGWPKVRILGREIGVLKRGGYGGGVVKEDGQEQEREVKAEELKTEGDEITNIAVKKEDKTDEWSISNPITSKSSTFIARSLPITSPTHARAALSTLLSQNPSLASASHNISAFRVCPPNNSTITEESNDDGESGGGRHLLSILKSNNILGVLLVVTRWYGGIMLGPDRWRIMTQVSNEALAQRLRVTGEVSAEEQLWGLDMDALGDPSRSTAGEMPIHRPEGARRYVMNAFGSPEEEDEEGKKKTKKKTGKMIEEEKEKNLGLLLGALDLLFESWVGHIGKEELDRRAWGWYVQCRPEVESGVAGWGGKGVVKLADILALRRKV